jgi:hypothetical protein
MYEEDIQNLLQFMYEAHINTYAAPREVNQKHQLLPPKNAGHIEFLYTKGPWSYHDSYVGEQNAPGKEIIYYNGQPVWTMSYQSKLHTDDAGIVFETYEFLKEALSNNTPEQPFRGPKEYEKGGFTYSFIIQQGDIKEFMGKEEIYYKGKLVYTNHTMGTLIGS